MARESSLEERTRKDEEKANYIKERQIRLGHVPNPDEEEEEEGEEEEEEEKPAAKKAESKKSK